MAVYDKEKQNTGQQRSKPTSDGLDTEQLRRAEQGKGPINDNPDQIGGDSNAKQKESLNADDLETREQAAIDNGANEEAPTEQSAGGAPDQKQRGLWRRSSLRQKGAGKPFWKRKRMAAGLLVGGGAIGTLLFFAPILRLESYLNSINQRVFGYATGAISARVETLFGHYMVSHILALERCNNQISINCKADYTKSGIATSLYLTWRDAKLEEKLFDRFGLEVTSLNNPDTSAGANKFTLKDRWGRQVTLTNADLRSGRFTGGSRELGREINKFLKEETRWHEVMQRRSMRKYLERKHGVKFWCFFACTTQDNAERRIGDAKTRFKYKFIERFVYPFSGKYGFIMDCITSGGNTAPGGKCSAEEMRKRGIDRQALSDEELKDLEARFTENPNLRFTQLATQKLLEKIMTQTAARTALSTIPIAGQVYLGLVIVDTFDRMDQFVADRGMSKMAADLKSRQYLEYYVGMRTVNDEMKAGKLSLDEVGAVMTQFEGAEDSKLYQANNPRVAQKQSTSSFASLFSGNALAQPVVETDSYRCPSGDPLPRNEPICPEKRINQIFAIEEIRNNKVVDGLAGVINIYGVCFPLGEVFGKCPGVRPRDAIRPLINGVNWVAGTALGPVLSGVLTILEHTPGAGDLVSFAKNKTGALFSAFFEKVFPHPVPFDSPPREKLDGLEGGGEVAAMEFGKGGYTEAGQPYGLGGKRLSVEEQTTVWLDYMEQENFEYESSSFFAKLTNLEHPNALGRNLVASMPTSFGQMMQKFSTMVLNPFQVFSFASPVNAQPLLPTSAFGIERYGYATNDPALTINPSALTPEYCQNAQKAWSASKKENEITGFDEYSVTNPCLLEQVVVESAGSIYTGNDSLDESVADADAVIGVSGDSQELAKKILQNSKISLAGRLVREDIQNTADGKLGSNNFPLNPYILQLIATIGEKHSVVVTSLEGGGTGHSNGSKHYSGDAVDFGSIDGKLLTGRDAGSLAILKIAYALLPSGTGYGESNCGATPQLPPGHTTFPDSCNHLHVQVPED